MTIAAACSASVVFLTAIMILIYLMARKKKREKVSQWKRSPSTKLKFVSVQDVQPRLSGGDTC